MWWEIAEVVGFRNEPRQKRFSHWTWCVDFKSVLWNSCPGGIHHNHLSWGWIKCVAKYSNYRSWCYSIIRFMHNYELCGSCRTKSKIINSKNSKFHSLNLLQFFSRFQFLYTTLTIGTSLSFSILGAYMLFKSMGYAIEAYGWIPIVSFSSILFVGAWGMLSLPFVIIAEVLPEKMKDFGATLCLTFIWFCLTIFECLDFHGTMFLFAGICLSSAIIIILFLPETKGKSHDEIMEMLR